MRFIDILNEDRVSTDLTAVTKGDALLALAELFAADDPQLDPRAVHDVLIERERLASTGVGSGVDLGRIRQIDVAPTLCALLGIDPPAQAQGAVLEKALAPPAAAATH